MENLTKKENNLLTEINACTHDYINSGYSDFTNEDVMTKSRAGVLSSLIQKGLVYDSYKNVQTEVKGFTDLAMYVITEKGVKSL
tara:strand:+ start:224 stop:475 length:252 start_codon:yes stop_codon:yes gene_type:complete